MPLLLELVHQTDQGPLRQFRLALLLPGMTIAQCIVANTGYHWHGTAFRRELLFDHRPLVGDRLHSLEAPAHGSLVTVSIGDPGEQILPRGEPLPEPLAESDESDFGQVSLSCRIPKPGLVYRPNAGIVIEQDDLIPYERHFSNGDHFSGRIIPPPRWHEQPIVRQAAEDGAVRRNGDEELMIHCRSWFLPHGEPAVRHPRDITIRAQLVVQLLDRLRRLWNDHVGTHDAVRMYLVSPTPTSLRMDTPRIHIILERNRPLVSNLRPILMSFQEISREGLSSITTWQPILSPPAFTLQDIQQVGHVDCEAFHLLIPQAARVRGWMGLNQQRHVVPGSYIPVWWDQRRVDPSQPGDEQPLAPQEETDRDSLLQLSMQPTLDHDANLDEGVVLMQRASVKKRRTEDPSPSTTPTIQAFHVFRLTTSYALMPAPRPTEDADVPGYLLGLMSRQFGFPAEEPASCHPVQATIEGLHNLPTFIYEHVGDRFSQLYTDDILALVDIVIKGHDRGEHRIRRVLWLRTASTRAALLGTLRCGDICEVMDPPCKVFLNNGFWPELDSVRRQFDYGDYLHVVIEADKPVEETLSCLRTAEIADRNRRIYLDTPPTHSPQSEESENWAAEEQTDSCSHSLLQLSAKATREEPIQVFRDITNLQQVPTQVPQPLSHVSDRWCTKGKDLPPEPTHPDHHEGSIFVEFQAAIQAFDWIDTHFLLPTYDLEVDWPWKKECLPWMNLPWWTPGRGAQQIWIYFDGSASRAQQCAGCGVVAYIFDGEWTFAGALSAQLQAGTTSYGAEAAGSVLAVKFLYDLLKMVHGGFVPEVWLCYDSTSVGEQTMGQWEARQKPLLFQFLRSLIILIEHKFPVVVRHHHIYGHSGDPGNELVDTLAWMASQGSALSNVEHFLDWVQREEFVSPFAWSWFLFRQDVPLGWKGSQLVLPAMPATSPDNDLLQIPKTTNEVANVDLHISLATLNVLTLKGAESKRHGLQGPTRQKALLQQIFEAEISIFALQETRQRRCTQAIDDHFFLIASQANPQGHFGMMLGFDKVRPHARIKKADGEAEDIFFKKEHLTIVHSEPRQLIVKIHSPALKCVVMAGHAPHTGAAADDCRTWWEEFRSRVPNRLAHWDRIVLTDANCRLGQFPSECVGTWQAEVDGQHSETFHDFLRNEHLWLPATYQDCHTGDSGTWRHPTGSWHRGDYVAIPQRWCYMECKSWVSEQIDASIAKEDHRAACVQIRVISEIMSTATRKTSRPFDEEALLSAIAQKPDGFTGQGPITAPSWEVDVHTHLHCLSADVASRLHSVYVPPAPKPRKSTMSAATWDLVLAKRSARNSLHALQKQQQWGLLRTCFAGWAAGSLDEWARREFSQILSQQDVLIAVELAQFREMGRRVTAAMRQDDIEFFTSLSQEASEHLAPGQAKRFWQIIRRALPQHKQRRSQPAPMSLQHLDDQWLPHFQQLECGWSKEPDQLVRDCHAFQMQRMPDPGTVFGLQEIPSLPELERAFRTTQARRSVGFDVVPSGVYRQAAPAMARTYFDLMIKEFTWGVEPIQHKGGPLAVIAKKKDWSLAKNFRGIMLLPSASKRVHALLRERILPLLKPVRPMGQIGGFRYQQTPFGSQAIRALSRTLVAKDYSVAVLFIDLSEAFHRLVRELVTGVVEDSYVQKIVQEINSNGIDAAGLQRWLQVPGLLQRLGCSSSLLRLLQDVHHHTWFTLRQQGRPSQTLRGTRPGSPLADIIFHVLMVDCLIEINHWIRQDHAYATILSMAGIDFDTICWADDLAIPWATNSANDLATAVQ